MVGRFTALFETTLRQVCFRETDSQWTGFVQQEMHVALQHRNHVCRQLLPYSTPATSTKAPCLARVFHEASRGIAEAGLHLVGRSLQVVAGENIQRLLRHSSTWNVVSLHSCHGDSASGSWLVIQPEALQLSALVSFTEKTPSQAPRGAL